MAITSGDIQRILNSVATPKGQWLSVSQIQDIISSNYNLQKDDLEPHTETRQTTYPVWKHRIQGVLSNLKNKGLIKHDSSTESYWF